MTKLVLYQLEVRNPTGEVFSGQVTFSPGSQREQFQLSGAGRSLNVIARTTLDKPDYRVCWVDLPEGNPDRAVIFHLGEAFQPFYQATGMSVKTGKFVCWRASVRLVSDK